MYVYVSRVCISCMLQVVDVSSLGRVPRLDLSRCLGLENIDALTHNYVVTLTDSAIDTHNHPEHISGISHYIY